MFEATDAASTDGCDGTYLLVPFNPYRKLVDILGMEWRTR
jgi:hypothetical protein